MEDVPPDLCHGLLLSRKRVSMHVYVRAPCSTCQETFRDMIWPGRMSVVRAARVANTLQVDVPWYSYADYIEALAALAALFPDESRRKTHVAGQSVAKLFYNATRGDRLGWACINIRMRRSVPRSMLAMLGSGTSPNEALHAEINAWYRQQPELFVTTLELQLRTRAIPVGLPIVVVGAAIGRQGEERMGSAVVGSVVALHVWRVDSCARSVPSERVRDVHTVHSPGCSPIQPQFAQPTITPMYVPVAGLRTWVSSCRTASRATARLSDSSGKTSSCDAHAARGGIDLM